ncbi:MAG TPA: hypothetical protein VGF67_09760 [Ktedonobacteraceae bacterium]
MERDSFVLLDSYLRDCLEKWCASDGHLWAYSIVLLDSCARSTTRRFRSLDSGGSFILGNLGG